MSEMSERIARAMIKRLRPAWQGGSDPREIDIDDSSVDFIELAEIAIAEMRVPTDAMLDYRDAFVKKSDALLVWQHQIDEALGKK